MRILSSIVLLCLTVGCASTNYQTYVETQKSLNKDHTMAELARISALTELAKESPDPNVRIQAIKALQEMQVNKKAIAIERPKSLFDF